MVFQATQFGLNFSTHIAIFLTGGFAYLAFPLMVPFHYCASRIHDNPIFAALHASYTNVELIPLIGFTKDSRFWREILDKYDTPNASSTTPRCVAIDRLVIPATNDLICRTMGGGKLADPFTMPTRPYGKSILSPFQRKNKLRLYHSSIPYYEFYPLLISVFLREVQTMPKNQILTSSRNYNGQ